jgi:hypothetical protein
MKVAIVAQGQSWRGARDADVDAVWAINLMGLRIRHDLLFHMDDCRVQEARAARNDNVRSLVEMLEIHPRFLTSTVYPEYPGAEAYPLEDVVNDLKTTYFNSTVAYAVGYAIHCQVDEIHLYGVDFSYPNVHKVERGRGCVEHLLGIARARGIEIVLPDDTTLMDYNLSSAEKPYGYCDAFEMEFIREGGRFHVKQTPRATPTAEEIERRYA